MIGGSHYLGAFERAAVITAGAVLALA